MLKFGAVHLDHGAGVPEEHLGRGFDDAGLTGASGTEKQEVPHRPAGRIQTGTEDLIQVHDSLHGFILSDNFSA
jgi:hypothetical protein